MNSTPRRKLRLSRETLRDVTTRPEAAFATEVSGGSWCAACHTQNCTGQTSI